MSKTPYISEKLTMQDKASYSRCCKMRKASSLESYIDKQKFKNHAELGQTLPLPFGGLCCPSFTHTNFKFLAYNLPSENVWL